MTERNFKVYFGGQIQKRWRGDQIAVLTSAGSKNGARIYLEKIGSEDFIYLTGVSTIEDPLERVYIGINSELAGKICLKVEKMRRGSFNAKALDEFIVMSSFIH